MRMLVVSGSYQNCENGVVSQLMIVGLEAVVNLLMHVTEGVDRILIIMYRRPTLYPLEIAVDFLKSL
jgi:hypothetical protein